jgi:heme-degrading monooxygenase HmoA
MCARVTTAIVPKEKLAQIRKRAAEFSWPETKKMRGYKGYLTLTNAETGDSMTISVWDTEEAMKAAEKAPYFSETRKLSVGDGVNILGTKYYVVGIKE